MAKRGGYITTGERVRSFIGWAFVISIVAHLAIGSVLPNFNKHAEEQKTEEGHGVKRSQDHRPHAAAADADAAADAHAAAADDAAAQTAKQVAAAEAQSQPRSPAEQQRRAGSTENTVASRRPAPKTACRQGKERPRPRAATAPPGTPKPSCANPNVEATVTNPVQPEYPESAKEIGLGAVTVTGRGHGRTERAISIGAKIYKSSSNMAIDQAALRAARESTYSPKLIDCAPSQGDYLFRADFTPGD